MSVGGFNLRRLGAVIAKEFIQMRRDRLTFAMMIGIPIMQLILFGFAINTDPRHMPPNFYYDQQDLLVERSDGRSWSWSGWCFGCGLLVTSSRTRSWPTPVPMPWCGTRSTPA